MNTKSCFAPAHILLPSEQIPLEKWGCIACDQFTSDRDYWKKAEAAAAGSPSTLNMILPEVYLEDGDADARIEKIHATMDDYARNVLTRAVDGFVYVERTEQSGKVRQGLVGMVDLEAYSYRRGEKCTVRPSESTVESRIPPRMKVRTGAALETPHIMMLADDPDCTLIEPIAAHKDSLPKVYEGELMLGGGHVAGWAVEDPALIAQIENALTVLGSQEEFDKKYPDATRRDPLTLAVGDGNHSLATAKACWEELKKTLTPEQAENHPARWCLAEVCNVHSPAIEIEPIHRVLFHVDGRDLWDAFQAFYPGAHTGGGEGHTAEVCGQGMDGLWTVPHPKAQLTVGTLQAFLDAYCRDHPEVQVDYIHGDDVARKLGSRPGNLGFLLPLMGKEQLFPTVMADGVLPRKTFSMGEARDKRYYLEARRIR